MHLIFVIKMYSWTLTCSEFAIWTIFFTINKFVEKVNCPINIPWVNILDVINCILKNSCLYWIFKITIFYILFRNVNKFCYLIYLNNTKHHFLLFSKIVDKACDFRLSDHALTRLNILEFPYNWYMFLKYTIGGSILKITAAQKSYIMVCMEI